jgi:hypothetical protein
MSRGLIALIVLAAIHLFANRAKVLGWVWRGQFLSFASGISLAYVFVDLLPALEKGSPVLKQAFGELLPFLELHTYLLAMLGILFYYGVESAQTKRNNSWLPISGYLLFNFLVGAGLSDSSNPEIQPLVLFTFAIGMHYFVRDRMANVTKRPAVLGALILALFAGYLVGYLTKIPPAASAIGISFVAGGMILNIFRYELPKKEKGGYVWFVLGALLYTTLLLTLGKVNA